MTRKFQFIIIFFPVLWTYCDLLGHSSVQKKAECHSFFDAFIFINKSKEPSTTRVSMGNFHYHLNDHYYKKSGVNCYLCE